MKLKTAATLCVILALTGNLYAQFGDVGYPETYFSFNAGYCMPIGSYSGTTAKDWTGYAKGGNAYSILVGLPFGKANFGIAVMAGFNRNSYDASTFGGNISAGDSTNLYSTRNSSYSTITAISYAQYYLMGGLLIASNSNNSFSFDGRLVIGFEYINYPNPYWTTTSSAASGNMEQWYLNTTPTTTFAFAIGGGGRYSFPGGLTIVANLDFIHTNASPSTTQIIDNGNNQSLETTTANISVSVITITLGVGYSF